MSPTIKPVFVALIAAGACTSVKPAPKARTSEEIVQRLESVAQEDFSPEQADVAVALRGFARAYQDAHKYSIAELLFQRALTMQEAVAPEDHDAISQTLRDFFTLYRTQKKWAAAEPLMEQYIALAEKYPGQNNIKLLQDLREVATFYEQDQQYDKAEPLLRRVLALSPTGRGAPVLLVDRLARVLQKEGKNAEAEDLFKETLAAQEKAFGENSPSLMFTLQRYSQLLRELGKTEEAERLSSRAKELMSQSRSQSQSSTNPPMEGVRKIPFRREE